MASPNISILRNGLGFIPTPSVPHPSAAFWLELVVPIQFMFVPSIRSWGVRWGSTNTTGDSDEASSCSELLLGAWARLEVGVGLQYTDLKLLVWGMQDVTERLGLNNLGLFL